MIFLLRCPHCRNNMKYQTKASIISKRKVCVYCGKSFKVRDNLLKKL